MVIGSGGMQFGKAPCRPKLPPGMRPDKLGKLRGKPAARLANLSGKQRGKSAKLSVKPCALNVMQPVPGATGVIPTSPCQFPRF
jgi:hypothetical protein